MRLLARTLVILLPVLFALGGAAAGPALARLNYAVWLADDHPWEEAADLPSDQRKAFLQSLRTHDPPLSEEEGRDRLLAEARSVESVFLVGGAAFGAWCGLVLALKIAALSRVPRRTDYEIDSGACVSCGRCFRYCPRERLRLKKLGRPVRTM